MVGETAPEATSQIKWGMPFYSIGDEMMCALAGFKAHVNLILPGPPGTYPDPDGRLEGDGKTGKHLKLRALDDLPRAAVRDWLRVAADRARGADSLTSLTVRATPRRPEARDCSHRRGLRLGQRLQLGQAALELAADQLVHGHEHRERLAHEGVVAAERPGHRHVAAGRRLDGELRLVGRLERARERELDPDAAARDALGHRHGAGAGLGVALPAVGRAHAGRSAAVGALERGVEPLVGRPVAPAVQVVEVREDHRGGRRDRGRARDAKLGGTGGDDQGEQPAGGHDAGSNLNQHDDLLSLGVGRGRNANPALPERRTAPGACPTNSRGARFVDFCLRQARPGAYLASAHGARIDDAGGAAARGQPRARTARSP